MLCLAELTARAASGGYIRQYLADREARGLSPRSIQFYHEKLSRVGPLLRLSRQDIQRFLVSLPCSPGGKHTYLRVLRAFYFWAEDDGLVTQNPCRRVTIKVPKPLRYTVPVDAIPTLLAACESDRDRLIVSLLAGTGLRLSELASITEVNRQNRSIRVWGKGAKQRVVRYGPNTDQLIARRGLTSAGITSVLRRLGQKTGIKCNAHAFRRTFATQQIRGGMNLFHVQSLLEHESLIMTRLYADQVASEDAITEYKPVVARA